MKLAEALAARSDMNKKLGDLRSRTADNMFSSETSVAAEDSNDLLAQAHSLAVQIMKLVIAVNATNSATVMNVDGEEMSVMKALALRDMLASQHKTLVVALDETSRKRSYFRDDNRGALTVSVPQLRAKADEIAGKLRALDLTIQQVNWATELIE
jgi:hypothetical protein